MIIVKLISGLGNQLFQYALGRRVGLEKNVPVKLDLSFYDDQDLRAYKLHHYPIKAEIASRQEKDHLLWKDRNMVFRKIRQRIDRFVPYYKKRSVKEQERFVYDPNIFKTGDDILLVGYWQNYRYIIDIQHELQQELTLKQQYQGKAQEYLKQIKSHPDAVSVHIRRGDYVNDAYAKNRFGSLSDQYYSEAVALIRQKTQSPHLFIFSDEIDWVKENMHFECDTSYINLENDDLDYVELDLMTHCKHNIIANSTFSWWGAFLNQHPDQLVIAPKQWSRLPEVNQTIEIQLPDWILI